MSAYLHAVQSNSVAPQVTNLGVQVMKKVIAALAITAFAAGAAFAQVTFESVDADTSGTVTPEEAQAAGITEEQFAAADADGDGALNAEEFATIGQ